MSHEYLKSSICGSEASPNLNNVGTVHRNPLTISRGLREKFIKGEISKNEEEIVIENVVRSFVYIFYCCIVFIYLKFAIIIVRLYDYEIQLENGKKQIFHINMLKEYFPRKSENLCPFRSNLHNEMGIHAALHMLTLHDSVSDRFSHLYNTI